MIVQKIDNVNFREALIQRIKNAGQEIIDRADEIAGADNALITDLSINVHISIPEAGIDTVSWTTEVLNRNHIKNCNERN